MDKSKKSPTGNPPSISKECNLNDINLSAQRQRLLATLQGRAVSTLFARSRLNILSPAGRIYELRRRGYKIITHWSVEFDTEGRRHRVAKYVLLAQTEFSGHG